MDPEADAEPSIVLAASREWLVRARATVRSAPGRGPRGCLVVDLDGTYQPVAQERVVTLAALAEQLLLGAEANRAAATLEPDELALYAGALAAELAFGGGSAGAVLLARAGVLIVRDPAPFLRSQAGSVVWPDADADGAARRALAAPPAIREVGRTGRTVMLGPGAGPVHSAAMVVLGSAAHARKLRVRAADWRVAADALQLFAPEVGAIREPADALISAWGSTGIDQPDRWLAVDLSTFDHHRPSLLDPDSLTMPQVLLSEHPVLARLVSEETARRLVDETEALPARAPRVGLDAFLRAQARRDDLGRGALPDVLGLGTGPGVDDWALAPVPEGVSRPVARYLAAVRHSRPDLLAAFPDVPGRDTKGLAAWAVEYGVGDEAYDADLLVRAAAATRAARTRQVDGGPLADGVNVVGYLAGELGVGTSARLVEEALRAADVPTSTVDVSGPIASRRGAAYRRSDATLRRTTLLCVNAGETAGVMRTRGRSLRRTRVIGMWYWELEDFPASQHGGFAHVDEVWAATDFIRDAIARHAGGVPVRTVPPPLPQAGSDPGELPPRFGIPQDRPWFLFTFDFLSFAARKNPLGLVEAFTRAFGATPASLRPTLVIKTINADRHPGDAEALRLRVAGRRDVILVETYLDDHERHVLVAHCTAYVSLHHAEGLGLTVAEAMAWGRPVITTAYGGVTQFCDNDNAFLVRWTPTRLTETVGPYERGATWAEPDLDEAARLMRLVVDEPSRAAAVGDRAARDIRERHNVAVAGKRMLEVLRQGDRLWAERQAAPAAEASSNGDRARGVWRRLASAVKARSIGR